MAENSKLSDHENEYRKMLKIYAIMTRSITAGCSQTITMYLTFCYKQVEKHRGNSCLWWYMYKMSQNNRQRRIRFEKLILCEQRGNQPRGRFLVQTFPRSKGKKYAKSRGMQLASFSCKLTLITYSFCLVFLFLFFLVQLLKKTARYVEIICAKLTYFQ